MKKQETGQKRAKNPKKKVSLSAPLTSWPGQASSVFARFLSCFLFFHGQFVYEMPFLEEKNQTQTFHPAALSSVYQMQILDLQQIPGMYQMYQIQIVREKVENWTKIGQKTSKRGVFQHLRLLAPVPKSWQLLRTNSASWSKGLIKTPYFGGFSPNFRPVSCFFTDSLYIIRIF